MKIPNNSGSKEEVKKDNESMEEVESDDETESNYVEFKTKNELRTYLDDHDKKLLNQINYYRLEIEKLKQKDVEIKMLNDNLHNFKNDILKKYEASNIDLNDNDLNYSSLDELEKSILRNLNDKRINYKKSEPEEGSNKQNTKLYI